MGIDQTKKSTLTRVSAAKKRERSVTGLKAEFETLGVTGLAEKDEDAHFNRARSASKGPKDKRAKLDGVDPHATKGSVARSKSGIRGEDAAKLAILKKKREKREERREKREERREKREERREKRREMREERREKREGRRTAIFILSNTLDAKCVGGYIYIY